MKQYHIIGAGLLNLDEMQPAMNKLAADGFKVISVTTVDGAVVWTMERDAPAEPQFRCARCGRNELVARCDGCSHGPCPMERVA